MYCIKCGNELKEMDRFCTKCGEKTDDAPNLVNVEKNNVSSNVGKGYVDINGFADIIEKMVYLAVLFLSSISMIILMYSTWISQEYSDYKFGSSLLNLFNQITGYPEVVSDSLEGKENTSMVLVIILVILFIFTLVFIIAFLMRMAQSRRKPKGFVLGFIAMTFSIILFILTVITVIVTNGTESDILNTLSVAASPYIFLILSIVNIVLLILLATVDKRRNKRIGRKGAISYEYIK